MGVGQREESSQHNRLLQELSCPLVIQNCSTDIHYVKEYHYTEMQEITMAGFLLGSFSQNFLQKH